jgi:colanic acid biosynthesis protein WcaH
MFLDKKEFSAVIENTPLVSIDLVIKNTHGQTLLGKRLNKPAKGYWFVPGGRILKNESLEEAFKRLTLEELGESFSIKKACLLGPYDHFYPESVFKDEVSTHYIAIAYILIIDKELAHLPIDVQHAKYQWFDINELLNNEDVHLHTKWYFNEG